jgi:hypothetical protein
MYSIYFISSRIESIRLFEFDLFDISVLSQTSTNSNQFELV